MGFHRIPNCAEVDMVYNFNGQNVENVYHIKGTAPWDATSLNTLNNLLGNWETSVAAPIRSNFVELVKIHSRDMSVANGPEIDTTFAVPGALTAEPMPQNVTIAVKAQTGLAGRAYRGRSFWIGLVVSDQGGTAGQITPAKANQILNAMTQLLSVAYPNGGQMVVVHRREGTTWIDPPVQTPVVSWAFSDLNIDSQRRRLPGHNRHR